MVGREIGVIYCKVVTLARTMCVSLCANINSLFQIPVMSAACSDDPRSARLSALCLPDLPVLGSGHWSVTSYNLIVCHLENKQSNFRNDNVYFTEAKQV